MMSTRDIVLEEVKRVAEEHHKSLPPLTNELPLLESGLNSLCLAVIVARLEERLGVDPFAASDDVGLPVTIGDLVGVYEAAAADTRPAVSAGG